jgi:hypothetical protein
MTVIFLLEKESSVLELPLLESRPSSWWTAASQRRYAEQSHRRYAIFVFCIDNLIQRLAPCLKWSRTVQQRLRAFCRIYTRTHTRHLLS